jgi:hypothetical protein
VGGRCQPALRVRRGFLEVAPAAELRDQFRDGVQGSDAEMAPNLVERRREAATRAKARDEVVGGSLPGCEQVSTLRVAAA